MCNCIVTEQVLRLYFQRLNYRRAQLGPKICAHPHYWTTIFSLLIDDTTTSPKKWWMQGKQVLLREDYGCICSSCIKKSYCSLITPHWDQSVLALCCRHMFTFDAIDDKILSPLTNIFGNTITNASQKSRSMMFVLVSHIHGPRNKVYAPPQLEPPPIPVLPRLEL